MLLSLTVCQQLSTSCVISRESVPQLLYHTLTAGAASLLTRSARCTCRISPTILRDCSAIYSPQPAAASVLALELLLLCCRTSATSPAGIHRASYGSSVALFLLCCCAVADGESLTSFSLLAVQLPAARAGEGDVHCRYECLPLRHDLHTLSCFLLQTAGFHRSVLTGKLVV